MSFHTARFYIWPRYALEIRGRRVVFPPRVGAMLARLYMARGHDVSREELIEAVYFDDPEGGPLCADECLKVFAFRVRKILAKVGVRLIGWRCEGGYRLILGGDPYGLDYVEKPVGHAGPYRFLSQHEPDSYSVGDFLEGHER